MVTLIAIFAALALFTASALVLLIIVGERPPIEVRLAALRSRSGVPDDTEAPVEHRAQDLLALITRPFAPFRNWLKSNDEELSYRLWPCRLSQT